MNKELISVIVPIYNVEKYLEKCITTIVNQTYKETEIILVDDGSTDSCPKICDNWLKKDERIKVIHKKNGGLSDARNAGIDIAKGKYICFVDSDDYLEKNYIEKLYFSLKENNTNISQCGIKYVDENNRTLKTIGYSSNCLISGRQAIIESLNEHFVENEVVWNRLYKKNIFDIIQFPVGRIHEDEYVIYKILYNEEKISIISDALYCYRQSNTSIMRSNYNLKKFKDFCDAYDEKIMYFRERNDIQIHDMVIRSYLSNLSNIYIKLSNNREIGKEVLQGIRVTYKKLYKKVTKSKNISIKNKLKVSIFYYSPKLYIWLKNIKKR